MFESVVEKTIITTAIVLWFAHGWYLNEKLADVHKKLDLILETFDGLRSYLYEIDPQFSDERAASEEFESNFENGTPSFAGMYELELLQKKRNKGKRTLNSPF